MTVETTQLDTRSCANCGTTLAPDARFCQSCGTAVQPPAPAQQSAASVGGAVAAAGANVGTVPAVAATVEGGLLSRAKRNDRNAIETMFKQFLAPGEDITAAEYLGVYGFWGFGRDSFGVVTDRRVASLQVGSFGEVSYQDGSLEYVNSTVLYQPSRFGLYPLASLG